METYKCGHPRTAENTYILNVRDKYRYERCRICRIADERKRWTTDEKYRARRYARNKARYHADPVFRKKVIKQACKHHQKHKLASLMYSQLYALMRKEDV